MKTVPPLDPSGDAGFRQMQADWQKEDLMTELANDTPLHSHAVKSEQFEIGRKESQMMAFSMHGKIIFKLLGKASLHLPVGSSIETATHRISNKGYGPDGKVMLDFEDTQTGGLVQCQGYEEVSK